MTRAEAHRMLDAVRDGTRAASSSEIRDALKATGDVESWQRIEWPVVETIRVARDEVTA